MLYFQKIICRELLGNCVHHLHLRMTLKWTLEAEGTPFNLHPITMSIILALFTTNIFITKWYMTSIDI